MFDEWEWEVDAEIAWHDTYRKIERGIWTQRDGTEIQIEDMSDRHLNNTIRMLERKESKSDYVCLWLITLRVEQMRRAKQKAAEDALNSLTYEDYVK